MSSPRLLSTVALALLWCPVALAQPKPAPASPREAKATGPTRVQELEASLAESRSRLAPRCPDCGAIGSLEEIDGVTRCIECDEVVAATAPLGGFGRR